MSSTGLFTPFRHKCTDSRTGGAVSSECGPFLICRYVPPLVPLANPVILCEVVIVVTNPQVQH